MFNSADDYRMFEELLFQFLKIVPMRLFSYCAMPNHWHLIVSPTVDLQLGIFMHRFEGAHAKWWHKVHASSGTGAVYQGRYKPVEIKNGRHFLTACRYVERNAKKAGLVTRAEEWQWASLWRRSNNCHSAWLENWPVPVPAGWTDIVNAD